MNRGAVIDVLAAGRVANLPSVVSNVIFGSVILSGAVPVGGFRLFVPALAACALYLGGCFLNDWQDQSWDRQHKPERALPSGRLGSSFVLLLALVSLGLGLAFAFGQNGQTGAVALVLIAFIGLYTWLHKKTAWGIVPMGCCRGALYMLGFMAQGGALILASGLVLPVLGLSSYVAGLSLLARYEAKGVLGLWKKGSAFVLLTLPGLLLFSYSGIAGVLGTLFFGVVAAYGQRLLKTAISRGVSFFLAAICLVDFGVLTLLASVGSAPYLWPFAGLSLCAFVLALVLQRIAPAT